MSIEEKITKHLNESDFNIKMSSQSKALLDDAMSVWDDKMESLDIFFDNINKTMGRVESIPDDSPAEYFIKLYNQGYIDGYKARKNADYLKK